MGSELIKNRAKEWGKALKELRSTREQFWRHVEIVIDIRDKGLHLEQYGTFEDFMKLENGWSKSHGYELIAACEVRQRLSDVSDNAPTKITHLTAFGKAPVDKQVEAFANAEQSAEAEGRELTVGDIKREVKKVSEPKAKSTKVEKKSQVDSTPKADPPKGKTVCCPTCEGSGAIDARFIFNMPESLDTEAFRASWAEWVAFRKTELKKPLKPMGIKKQIKMCREWGEQAAIQAIENSITNGYTGLFDPRKKRGKGDAFFDPDTQGMEYQPS